MQTPHADPAPGRCRDGMAHLWGFANGWALDPSTNQRVSISVKAVLPDGSKVPLQFCKRPGCWAQRPFVVAPEAVGMTGSGPL